MQRTKELQDPVSLYFGIGLCNHYSVTQGLPIDVLGMLLVGSRIAVDKHVLIADSHAKTNGFDHDEIDGRAHDAKEILEHVCGTLGLVGWNVHLASGIDTSLAYQTFLDCMPGEHEYVRRELADMAWFRNELGVNLKLGWFRNGSRSSSEASFDEKFSSLFPGQLSFAYIEPGRTFDPGHPIAAPYFCSDSASRILLSPGENAADKFRAAMEAVGQRGVKPYTNLLNRLVRLYDTVVERTERGTVEQRIQQILGRCFP
ncbi:hypothetical protein J4464_05625 [Candidatus Woesearchaeota archaeon]|nr:hypothetical protein [Candidatus Woesearchaeota archaeon]